MPTPWSPPETLYAECSNLPPACSTVSTTSAAGRPLSLWMSTGIPRPLSPTEQEHGRAADRLRHRAPLRQPQRQRHQPQLPARAEAPQLTPIEGDAEVVAVRSHQRHPPPPLVLDPALEGRAEPGRRRLVAETR